jgi:uncharacterized repeat protein (TIGR01451 family)
MVKVKVGTGDRRMRHRREKAVSGATAAGLLVSSAVAVLALGAPSASAAPGTPGVAQAPKTLFAEHFENGVGTAPVLLTAYTGASGTKYTADPGWLTGCNGVVTEYASPDSNAGAAGCSPGSFTSVKNLAWALGKVGGAGDPTLNHAVTAYTEGNPGVDKVQIETVNPIPLTVNNRFITFSVDAAALNCYASAPQYNFSLLDQGTVHPIGGTIDPCTDGRAQNVTTPSGAAAKAGSFAATSSLLFTGSSVGIRMTNANGSGVGNDAAFDNIQILDVTPQLDKSFSPASTPSATDATVTFTITNTSELGAKNGWSFTDALPSGLKLASAPTTTCTGTTASGSVGSSTIAVTNGNLDRNQTTCTVTAKVTSPVAGSFTNAPGNITSIVGLNPPADTSVRFTPSSDLVSNKTVDNETPRYGDNVVYTVTLRNDGPDPAANAKLTDKLPAGLTYVSDDSASSGTSYDSSTGVWTAGDIAVGETKTLKITAKVDTTAPVQNKITESSSDSTDPTPCDPANPGNCSETTPPTITPVASDLSDTKTVDNTSPRYGENVVFTLTLKNNGPSDATGARLTDKLPAGLTYVSDDSASTGTSYDPATGVWRVGDLANGESKVLLLTARVESTTPVQNVVTGTDSDNPDPNPCDEANPGNCGTPPPPVTPVYAHLRTTKTADPAMVKLGGTFDYVITVTNTGNTDTAGVKVTDKLPAGATYLSDDAASTGTGYDPATGIWSVGDLATGQTQTLRITARADARSVNKIQEATSDLPDPDPCDPVDGCAGTEVVTPPIFSDLEATKTVDNSSPVVGSNVNYTVTVTNKGTDPAPSAFVIDKLPSGLQYVSSDPSKGSYDPSTGRWEVGDMAVGDTETLKLVAKVLTTDTSATTNKITGTGSDNPDPTPCPPDCGSQSIVVLHATLAKEPVKPGPASLAHTGADLGPLFGAGLLALVVGAGTLTLTVRRRRRI